MTTKTKPTRPPGTAQKALMLHIAHHKPRNAYELSQKSGIGISQVTSTLRSMIKRGWVEWDTHQTPTLTAAGRKQIS